jgi:hypothetical protein
MWISFGGAGHIAELTDNRYEITHDPAWRIEKKKFKAKNKHWYEWIPRKNGGIISLFNEDEKVFKLTTKKRTGEKVLREVKEAQLWVEFHDEVEILFSLKEIHQVAKLAKAKRRRGRKSLSPEGKQKLVESGEAFRFSEKITGKKGQKSPRIPFLFNDVR